MPIRYDILEALQRRCEAIQTANGYNYTVVTAVIEARSWDDPQINQDSKPWIGIVPQEETWQDQPGHVVVDWPIVLLFHFDVSTRTHLGVAEACDLARDDLYRALYLESQIGVDNVHFIRILSSAGSEGAPGAADEGHAGIRMRIMVRFSQDKPS